MALDYMSMMGGAGGGGSGSTKTSIVPQTVGDTGGNFGVLTTNRSVSPAVLIAGAAILGAVILGAFLLLRRR